MRSLRLLVALAALTAVAALGGTATARTPGPPTVAKIYEAFNYHGVVIPHVQVVSGYCTGSSAATKRVDAWRCVDGASVQDPCFSSEFANGVVCPAPWNNSAIEITLTQPLPKATNQSSPSLRAEPWAIQLASGADCIYSSTTTTRVQGKRLNYVCSAKLDLWGFPNRKKRSWTILAAPPNATSLRRHAAILHAWM
jgi:hypothetical protein